MWPTRLVVISVAVVAAVYATHQPGEVRFLTPEHDRFTDVRIVSVVGSVTNGGTQSIGLSINGQRKVIPVVDGAFRADVELRDGSNLIQPFSNSHGVQQIHFSRPLMVHSVANPGPAQMTFPPTGTIVVDQTVDVHGAVGLAPEVREHALRSIGIRGGSETVVAHLNFPAGTFEAVVPLAYGVNTLQCFSRNPDIRLGRSHEVVDFPEHTIIRCTDPRSIEFLSPKSGERILTNAVDVRVRTGDSSNFGLTLSVNGENTGRSFVADGQAGRDLLVRTLPLAAGRRNEVRVVAGEYQSHALQVITPLLNHDFEDEGLGDGGWTLRGRADSEQPRRISRPGGGYGLQSEDNVADLYVDLMFVIDTSQSMAEEITSVLNQVGQVTETLQWGDPDQFRTGLVTFSNGVGISLPLATGSRLKQRLSDAELLKDDRLPTGGGNNEKGDDQLLGVLRALDTDVGWRDDDRVTRIVVIMTDEDAADDTLSELIAEQTRLSSYDGADRDEILRSGEEDVRQLAVAKAKRRDVSIHTVLFPPPIVSQDHRHQLLNKAHENARVLATSTRGHVQLFEDTETDEPAWQVTRHTIEYAANTRNARMWVAPPEVLHQIRSAGAEASGCSFLFDIQQTFPETAELAVIQDAVVLSGQDTEGRKTQLVLTSVQRKTLPWGNWFEVSFDASHKWKHSTGESVSETELQHTLATLSDLWIRGDYHNGADISVLDNVVIFPVSSPAAQAELTVADQP
ncbi:MAG: VWA domain-containing protein [Planctomycetaceae bacterium]|nr:VWA domain-containing protein [Planctomycetaceae bacterium]